MNKSVIIVAGGSGSRMQSELPKQFIELVGKPILMHTIEKFANAIPSIYIVLVLPKNQFELWANLCTKHNFTIPCHILAGGETRFHSVQNGLHSIGYTKGIVGVHDGARPLVNQQTIVNAFEQAEQYGNAIPTVNPSESVRILNNNSNQPLNRDIIRLIQTPQCFKISILKKAYEQSYQTNFTDDASVIEAMGETVHLIPGNAENIKITSPIDLIMAEALISRR